MILHSSLQGGDAYEQFKNIALEFYGNHTYKFVGLKLKDLPTKEKVQFSAEFWEVGEDNPTEIIRCKDCKHLYFKDFFAYCPYMVGVCNPDGFCNHGKARLVKRTCFTYKNYKGNEICGFSGMHVKIRPDDGCAVWEIGPDVPKGT